MIGKAVDGVVDVTVNGTKLSFQAITIEGTSYLPIRAVGDALNLTVGYDETTGVSLATKTDPIQEQISALGKRARVLFDERSKLYNSELSQYENGLKPKDDAYYTIKKQYDEMSKELNDIDAQTQALVKQRQAEWKSK